MAKLYICLLALLPSILFSQQRSPSTIITTDEGGITTSGDTYAFVVGISNYSYIKPLSYADKDAELFVDFLSSKAAGKVKKDNITLLTNENASFGNFTSQLTKFTSKKYNKGDRAYIYFAGHGDAYDDMYYLLLHNCNPAGGNYEVGGGAYYVGFLKKKIANLSNQGVQVILILDACRTNELPGGHSSTAFLPSAETKAGEIMMLATSAGQVSIEKKEYANGHGLFTYKLIDALSGLADSEDGNNDGKVSFAELQDWVTRNVRKTAEKSQAKQLPFFCCVDANSDVIISSKDAAFISDWAILKNPSSGANTFAARGFRRGQTSKEPSPDSNLVSLYNHMNNAIKENRLWGENSAESYYTQLFMTNPTSGITNDAGYILAGELIDFAQQKINLQLQGKSLKTFKEEQKNTTGSQLLREQYKRTEIVLKEKWTTTAIMLIRARDILLKDDPTLNTILLPKIRFLLSKSYLDPKDVNKQSSSQDESY